MKIKLEPNGLQVLKRATLIYIWVAPLEKEMATHSSTLASKTPWTEEPGRLQPMGSQ